ncbi:MAG: hypothetical protein JXA95_14580 [Spirochaetales bacterium]|nr:hypothetical protein [Spirochaetales bacterium]
MKYLISSLTLILFLLFLGIRTQGGFGDSRPLFSSYDRIALSRIERKGQEGYLQNRGGRLYQVSGEDSSPVKEDWSVFLSGLPSLFTGNLAGRLDTADEWLPSGEETLIYHYGKDKTLTLRLRFPASSDEGEGLFLIGKGPGHRIYFLRTGYAFLPGEPDLRDRRLFPELENAGGIIYYRLSTPREGNEAPLYNYTLEKDSIWTYSGGVGQGEALKGENLNLLLLRLAGAEAAALIPREGISPDTVRFRIEIRDNRGNRFLLTVGDRVERNGCSSYLTQVEGASESFLMTRETLAGLAPPLNSLLDL